jgi:threonine/homoserine/homoserine lactone efflux protein
LSPRTAPPPSHSNPRSYLLRFAPPPPLTSTTTPPPPNSLLPVALGSTFAAVVVVAAAIGAVALRRRGEAMRREMRSALLSDMSSVEIESVVIPDAAIIQREELKVL